MRKLKSQQIAWLVTIGVVTSLLLPVSSAMTWVTLSPGKRLRVGIWSLRVAPPTPSPASLPAGVSPSDSNHRLRASVLTGEIVDEYQFLGFAFARHYPIAHAVEVVAPSLRITSPGAFSGPARRVSPSRFASDLRATLQGKVAYKLGSEIIVEDPAPLVWEKLKR